MTSTRDTYPIRGYLSFQAFCGESSCQGGVAVAQPILGSHLS